MINDVLDWFRGLFGDAADEATQAAEGAQETAQDFGGEALGGVTEHTDAFQDQVDSVSGVVEDPGGAAADAARDRLPGQE